MVRRLNSALNIQYSRDLGVVNAGVQVGSIILYSWSEYLLCAGAVSLRIYVESNHGSKRGNNRGCFLFQILRSK